MQSLYQHLKIFSRQNIRCKFKFVFPIEPTNSWQKTRFVQSVASSDEVTEFGQNPDDQSAIRVQNILKHRRYKLPVEIEWALDRCGLNLTEDLVLNVLRRHRSDSKVAYVFFNWVCGEGRGNGCYSVGSDVFNEIVDILGSMGRFEEMNKVFDEMSERKGIVNEMTFGVLIRRYAAAHKVEEAIGVYSRRREFGIEDDLVAFQKLLMWLCRYKHVEEAENLFVTKQHEFRFDIKTWNIVLNGWCVLGNVYEAKRFWKDIIASKCKPDLFTYSTFINALTKKGKLGTAMKLFRAMWDEGCNPDVVICNCIIDALCHKKRIPDALNVFREMNERLCFPNVVTYNSLIKHLCKIRRMEKVYEYLGEMEMKKGSCLPNEITYSYLLKSAKKPEEVPAILDSMERNGCKMNANMYNLMLKLYMDWDHHENVMHTWNEMERNGVGPDHRAYIIMIHGLLVKGKTVDAMRYLNEMTSKGMVPLPRTTLLMSTMNNNSPKKEVD